MTTTIAVSGKGGSGKTTLAALILRELVAQHAGPILAVDADPNACLGMTLGVTVDGHVADLREQARSKAPVNTGMDRLSTFEYGLNDVITEAQGFDLITMGRPEGPSCYCAANNLMRRFLDKLSGQYRFVILDNEAGMEHLSRRTTNDVDLLLVVADPSPIGRVTAERIAQLTASLPITIARQGVLWNRAAEAYPADGLPCVGTVPPDPAVAAASHEGRPIFELPTDSPALEAVRGVLRTHLLTTQTLPSEPEV